MNNATKHRDARANFFILGAPKCGTTSLADWLSGHPDVFVTTPKEPRFFNTDYTLPNRPRSLEEYRQLYKTAAGCTAVGEATTGYLVSRVAVPAILDYNPAANFVVCLRNPVEMFSSLHAQRLKEGTESEPDPAIAWRLQDERARGLKVPLTCPDPKTLLYGPLCQLGEQVERLFQHVQQERVLFVYLEDMKADAGREYRRVLAHIGVPDDGRKDFPVRNVGYVPRSTALSILVRALGRLKHGLGIRRGLGLGTRMNRLNRGNANARSPDLNLLSELQEYFADDIGKLARLTGRDLDHWMASTGMDTGDPGTTGRTAA
jgi:hypothetical protein